MKHYPLIALLTTLALGAQPLRAVPPKAFDVDCAAGDSINKALAKPGDELTINIRGICQEDVVVARDRVTLRGSDPAVDGIRAATVSDPFGSALLVRNARYVRVENLQLTGGRRAGLRIEDSRRNIEIVNCWIVDNQEFGLVMAAGLATAEDLLIADNGYVGVGISEAAALGCRNCSILRNPAPGQGFGVISTLASQLRFDGGTIDAGIAVWVTFNGFGIFNGTEIRGSELAIDGQNSGAVVLKRGLVDGSISLGGDSQATLEGTPQLYNPVGNRVSGGSLLTVGAGATVVGKTAVSDFGNAVFRPGSTVESASCSAGAKISCAEGVGMAPSSCGPCP